MYLELTEITSNTINPEKKDLIRNKVLVNMANVDKIAIRENYSELFLFSGRTIIVEETIQLKGRLID